MDYSHKEAAEQLGVPPSTLRTWGRQLAPLLSESARQASTGRKGAPRQRYTEDDLAIFDRARVLLQSGRSYAQVCRELAKDQGGADPILQEAAPIVSARSSETEAVVAEKAAPEPVDLEEQAGRQEIVEAVEANSMLIRPAEQTSAAEPTSADTATDVEPESSGRVTPGEPARVAVDEEATARMAATEQMLEAPTASESDPVTPWPTYAPPPPRRLSLRERMGRWREGPAGRQLYRIGIVLAIVILSLLIGLGSVFILNPRARFNFGAWTQGSGIGGQGSGIGGQGSGFRVQGSGFRVQGLGT